MKKLIYILPFCLFLASSLQAQDDDYINNSSYNRHYSGSSRKYSKADIARILENAKNYYGYEGGNYNDDAISKDCYGYYFNADPTDTLHANFKSVISTDFYSSDSLMTVKHIKSKSERRFNNLGETIFTAEYDSAGKAKDSSRDYYDNKGLIIRQLEYGRETDSSDMGKSKEEIWVRDKKHRVIKDSEMVAQTRWSTGDRYNVSTKQYDTAGNMIFYQELSFTVGTDEIDTTLEISRYDSKNRLIYSSNKRGSMLSRSYSEYDDKGNETFQAYVTDDDSSYTKTKYDDKGNEIAHEKYGDKNKLQETYTRKFEKNGNKVETNEKLSTADVLSCPNNTVTVTTSDSSDNILSEVETQEKDGHPFVTTTLHKYVFDKDGHILTDSSFTTEQGYMHSLLSIHITQNQFDKNGNMINEVIDGGGQYSNNSHEKWIYSDNSKMLYHATYNTCADEKPASEEIFIYYPDGKNIKESIDLSQYRKSETFYSKDSRREKEIEFPRTKTTGDSEEAMYKAMLEKMKDKMKPEMLRLLNMQMNETYRFTVNEYKK